MTGTVHLLHARVCASPYQSHTPATKLELKFLSCYLNSRTPIFSMSLILRNTWRPHRQGTALPASHQTIISLYSGLLPC